MKDADMQIMRARFDHVLNTTLSQLRLVTAYVVAATQGLDENSEDRNYLVAGLMELNALHMYVVQHMNELTTGISDPCQAARAVLADAQLYVAQMEAAAETADSPPRESPDGEHTEILIH